MLREKHGLRDCDAEFGGECEVEEFVVRRPPERVVDDIRALKRKPLERRAVIGYLVRDAVDDYVILLRLIQADAADGDHLGRDLTTTFFIDVLYYGFGERDLTPD